MIATVTLNPALDKCIFAERLLPNDTNRIIRTETDAGGKGLNASRILRELGTETMALGFVGGQTGDFIEHVLHSHGISTDFVHTGGETRTNIAVQEASGAPPTTFNEIGATITEYELDELIAKYKKTMQKSSMVVLGGSLPNGVPVDFYRTLIEIAHEAGTKVVLDSDGDPMNHGMQAKPFMIKPNRDEVKRLVGIEIKNVQDAATAAEKLAELGIELVVISLGSKGALARSCEGIWCARPPKVRTVSTIGSGDSMVAGIVHVINQGGCLEEALKWGSAAGAATAMSDGTEIGRRSWVLELLPQVWVKNLDQCGDFLDGL